MDHAARTGMIGAAFALGRSFQPNLLTRGSRDQAIITGTTAAGAYGVFSAGDAVLAAVAARFAAPGGRGDLARGLTALAVGAGGLAAARTLSWREHEPRGRAVGRLAGQVAVAVAGASALATASASLPGGTGRRAALIGALATGALSWAATRPWEAAPGSLIDSYPEVATHHNGQLFFEDSVREVSPPQMIVIAAGVAALTYGGARVESALTSGLSVAAARLLGGEAHDHRMLGRLTSAAITLGIARLAVGKVSGLLSKGGGDIEPGLLTPPQTPEVTGSPASGLAWDKQTREGARWLSMALPPSTIDAVMGESGARQPIRVYASLPIASTDEERAQVLLDEIDRTRALERSVFVLFSPTGSGYVNYVACETLEYLTRGDCASAAIQYSVLPSALSLTDVPVGTDQTRMVLNGIVQRLLAIPEGKRPRFFLFGESLGSWVSEDMFDGAGVLGLEGTGLSGALWIGTPAGTKWRKQIWGTRTIAEAPGVGPADVYLPRTISDWKALPAEERQRVRFLLLQNGDDPIPKFGSEMAWRKPDWLGPQETRPIGCPRGTSWLPGTSFLMTFIDMLNALTPTPGVFAEGGHDYRAVLPQAIRETWRLEASDAQMARVNVALRERELAWELYRDWAAAKAKPEEHRDEARAKVLQTASRYTGRTIDEAELHRIIDTGLEPRP